MSCSASTGYTVGRTVTGLTGSGLILTYFSGANRSFPSPCRGRAHSPFDRVWPGGAYVVVVNTNLCRLRSCAPSSPPAVAQSGLPMSPVCRCMCKRGEFRLCRKRRRRHHFLLRYRSDDRDLRLSECPWPQARHLSTLRAARIGLISTLSTRSVTIFRLAVDAATGALTPVPGSPFAAGTDPVALAFTPSGAFLYVANEGSDSLGRTPFTRSREPDFLAMTGYPTSTVHPTTGRPAGKVVYVANGASAASRHS